MKSRVPAILLLFATAFLHCESREIISDVRVVLEPDKGLILIPEGNFTMGNASEGAPRDEQPAHDVFLSAYYISQNLVTNEEYLEFWAAQDGGNSTRNTPIVNVGSQPWPQIVQLLPKHPVVGVSWVDAKAYTEWKKRRTGQPYRLPTEAEWEKAGRSSDGRIYPWGNESPDRDGKYRANFFQSANPLDGFFRTSPVSYYNGININTGNGASPYGLYDMSGNVWQWVEDLYDAFYYGRSPAKDPKGPFSNTRGLNVIRGGSYNDDENEIRITNRNREEFRTKREYIGFRVAMEVMNAD